MQTVLLVLTIIIVILTTSFFISVKLEYDVLNNNGKIVVTLFKVIPVFWSNITIAGEYLNFSGKKNKVFKVKIDLNDKQIQFFKDVANSLKKKIYLDNITINTLIAFENPFTACLLNGSLNVLVSMLYSYISSKNTDVTLNKNIQTGFRQNEIKFNVYASIMISLYDFVWAYFKAYKQQKRGENEKAHKLQQNG